MGGFSDDSRVCVGCLPYLFLLIAVCGVVSSPAAARQAPPAKAAAAATGESRFELTPAPSSWMWTAARQVPYRPQPSSGLQPHQLSDGCVPQLSSLLPSPLSLRPASAIPVARAGGPANRKRRLMTFADYRKYDYFFSFPVRARPDPRGLGRPVCPRRLEALPDRKVSFLLGYRRNQLYGTRFSSQNLILDAYPVSYRGASPRTSFVAASPSVEARLLSFDQSTHSLGRPAASPQWRPVDRARW
jgi:hypothetical protein